MSEKIMFEENNMVVYPAHGVGKIKGIKTQVIGGMEIVAYVVDFEREKMTLHIPVSRAENSGLRHLCSKNDIKKVNKTLRSRAKIGRGMWSRRAKEYESKINSGSIILLAEVVRDLHKNVNDPDRSYSERIIYDNAISRLSSEVASINDTNIEEASASLVKIIDENAASNEEKIDDLIKAPSAMIEDDDEFMEVMEEERAA